MRMRSILMAALLLAAVSLLLAPAAPKAASADDAAEAQAVPCEIVIAPDDNPLPTFPEVTFSHTAHQGVNCAACHHMMEAGSDIQACRDCHYDRDIEFRKEPTSFYRAWHSTSTYSCTGCHASRAYAKLENTGPIKCFDSGCHARQK